MRFYTTSTGEIMTDEFCGGGGASTGMELATGVPVAVAVNHDPNAILMHKTNHPHTLHLQASVWDVDPKEECRGYPVGLSWFSPDCKHFSKAKGAALVDRKIRGLAWIVLRWAGRVRPRVIVVENVEEFVTWGPVRKGKPVKKKAGQTFRKWLSQLEDLGYTVEWRELVGADFGAPTTRKRFVLVARCDGKPIVWPEPTHGPRDSLLVHLGQQKPWRSAAEVIDWTLPCPSIFDDKQTIKKKYGLSAVRPLAQNTQRRVIRGVDKFTIKSGSPFLVQVNHSGGDRAAELTEPVPTVTAKHGYGVVTPLISPLTIPNTCNSVGSPASEPVHTVTTAGNQLMVAPSLIQYHTEQSEKVRGQHLEDPIMTIDAANRYGLAAANLVEYYGNAQDGLQLEDPMHTVTAKDREGVVVASLTKYYGGVVGSEVSEPMPTITSIDHNALQTVHLVKMKGDNLGGPADEPVQTITASGCHHGLVSTEIVRATPGADLRRWPEVRALLNKHCGYKMADDEILLLNIDGKDYFIADIGLRMLTPRELYNAMGFPADYIIDRDYNGNAYIKTEQVARCGNAVCPPMAEAVVRANLPEWCGEKIDTMAALARAVAGAN